MDRKDFYKTLGDPKTTLTSFVGPKRINLKVDPLTWRSWSHNHSSTSPASRILRGVDHCTCFFSLFYNFQMKTSARQTTTTCHSCNINESKVTTILNNKHLNIYSSSIFYISIQ